MSENELSAEEVSNGILYSLRKALGVSPENTAFDIDLILFVNSTFSELNQLGVGPEEVFSVKDEHALWTDFIDDPRLDMVKAYILLDVKLMFDPPSSATVLNAMEKKRDEYEWRLNVAGDKRLYSEENSK